MSDLPDTIVLYQGIAAEAMKSSRGIALNILWRLAHEADKEHSAWLWWNDFFDLAGRVFTVGYVRDLLRHPAAQHFFITTGDRRIGLRGVKAVAETYHVTKLGRRQPIPTFLVTKGRAARRAATVSAALPDDRPWSQQTIQRELGVSPATVRNYVKDGCFRAIRQDTEIPMTYMSEKGRSAFISANTDKGVYVSGGVVMKRMPNLYVPLLKPMKSSARTRRVAAQLRQQSVDPRDFQHAGKSKRPAVYFKSVAQYFHCRLPKLGLGNASLVWGRSLDLAYIRTGKPNTWSATYVVV